MGSDDALNFRFDHLQNLRAQIGALQDFASVGIDDFALLGDHIIIIDDVFTNVEVKTLNLSLRLFNEFARQRAFDGHAVIHADAVHQSGNTVRAEAAHQFVLQREIEARRAGVALAARAATKLVVDAARFVAFGADDVQPAHAHFALVLFGPALIGLFGN